MSLIYQLVIIWTPPNRIIMTLRLRSVSEILRPAQNGLNYDPIRTNDQRSKILPPRIHLLKLLNLSNVGLQMLILYSTR